MSEEKYQRTLYFARSLARDLANREKELREFVSTAGSRGRAMKGCPNERQQGCELLKLSEFVSDVLAAHGDLKAPEGGA